jgi:cytochrome c553
MPAFVVGEIRVTDPTQWQGYVERVGSTFGGHGGTVLFRGRKRIALNGNAHGESRTEPQMEPFVKDLSRQDMFDIAAVFAAQKPRATAFKADPARAARGKAKADETLCTMCHLGGFLGQNEIPRVAGQHYEYIVKQMRDFKAGKRTNDAGNMASVSKTLSDQDIEDLGHYLAGLY